VTGPAEYIYTGKLLGIGDYVTEHFIPYQCVVHNMMWNLIPADKSFNSHKTPKNKFLEDYLSVFPNLEIDKDKLAEHIRPMLTIAHHNWVELKTTL
jgi:hypothetical protein